MKLQLIIDFEYSMKINCNFLKLKKKNERVSKKISRCELLNADLPEGALKKSTNQK
jgi:hypothetical protein